jgi:hypothetical protein
MGNPGFLAGDSTPTGWQREQAFHDISITDILGRAVGKQDGSGRLVEHEQQEGDTLRGNDLLGKD